MNRYITAFLLCLTTIAGMAQPQGAPMADLFRENGKIYVVIAVIAVIFICLLIFMVYLERKLRSLEKKLDQNTKHTAP